MKPEGRYYSKNIDVLGYHDLNNRPGFQMALLVTSALAESFPTSFHSMVLV